LDEVFFFNNLRHLLLRCCWCVLLLSPHLPDHGGVEWGGAMASSYNYGEGWGDQIKIKLIHDRGFHASTIYYRRGGMNPTSIEEALRICCGSSTSHGHHVVRPRWYGGKLRQRTHAGREPPSYLLLFLGGNAWRTPAIIGGVTQGVDCVHLCNSRVFVESCKALSSNSWLLKAIDARALLQKLYLPILMKCNCTCRF
jgi:hypothetical protein